MNLFGGEGPNSMTNNSSNALLTVPPVMAQLLALFPLVFEQLTGEKIPPMSGTLAEILSALQKIQTSQAQMLSQQQELANKMLEMEGLTTSQLSDLDKQIKSISSIRLTHEKETKAIEYNQNI